MRGEGKPMKTRPVLATILMLLAATSLLAQAGSGTHAGRKKNAPAANATANAKPAQVGTQIPCPAQAELVHTPELITNNGRLRATVIVTSEKERIGFRYPLQFVNAQGQTQSVQPGQTKPPSTTAAFTACYEQWVRAFRSPDAVPAYPTPKAGVAYVDPTAGPTLRAQLGDVIELTFLNTIDPANFGDSIDRGDKGGCDESGAGGSTYPKGANDTYPDCFHGSTTANIHFHGTHTNPNTTGDNVFVEVLSSKRLKDEPPPDDPKFRSALFDSFFNKCEQILLKAPHVEWPTNWSQLPDLWTAEQKRLLQKFDSQNPGQRLWNVNERQLKQGAWPQYYIGEYPYCFRLPQFTEPTPPTAGSPAAEPHTHGAGTAELGADSTINEGSVSPTLIMGQAPGTHWYHAHKHGSTTIDVSNGMTGAFIIEGGYDQAISAYYDPSNAANGYPQNVTWTRKQPVIVINQLGVSSNLMTGGPGTGQDKGPDFSVNGRYNPFLTLQPGEVKMLRIVNSSSRAGAYFVGPPSGFHWKQIAQDGVQFNSANWTDPSNMDRPFLLAAGNRADLLVSAPPNCTSAVKGACLAPLQVYVEVDPTDLPNPPGSFPPFLYPLLTFRVQGTPLNPPMTIMPTAPPFPSFLNDITDQEVRGTKKVAFASTAPPAQHTIDGHKFDGEVGEVVLLNTVEEWKVSNATANPNISHPFHIHINPFQIVEVFDPKVTLADGSPKYLTYMPSGGLKTGQCYLNPLGDPDSWKSCDPPKPVPKNLIWWDVFPIPSGIAATDANGNPINDSNGNQIIIPGYFRMRSRFVDFAGYYVLHCHILAHEDRGMMTIVEVAPIIGPYSHH